MNEDLLETAANLVQMGKRDDAAELYHKFLRATPRHFEALNALGMIYFNSNQWEKAQYLLDEASKLDPFAVDLLCIRGIALARLNRHEESLACLDRALSVRPDSIDVLCNRATVLQEMKRYDEALAAFDQVLAMRPDHANSWNNRGTTYVALERREEALADFERAYALDPNLTGARDNLFKTRFVLNRIERSPPEWMRTLFDAYVPTYDDHMLNKLQYRGHSHLRTLAERIRPGIAAPLSILDLGCGTGLVGEAFKDLAAGGRLDGIDISPRMIDASRARGIYADLRLGDIETVLAEDGPQYDLILAADTMIYFGDLTATLKGVAGRLKSGGLYVFAVESKDGEGWEATREFRFRHSDAYLRSEAAKAGLAFAASMDCTLRTEKDVPVAGCVVALKKPD